MLTITEDQAKDALGTYIDQARSEPVFIRDADGKEVVILDSTEFHRLKAMDEAYWGMTARQTRSNVSTGSNLRANAFIQKRSIEELAR